MRRTDILGDVRRRIENTHLLPCLESLEAVRETTIDLAKQPRPRQRAEFCRRIYVKVLVCGLRLDAGSTSARDSVHSATAARSADRPCGQAQALLRAELRSSHGPAFSAEADELLSSLRQDAEDPRRCLESSKPRIKDALSHTHLASEDIIEVLRKELSSVDLGQALREKPLRAEPSQHALFISAKQRPTVPGARKQCGAPPLVLAASCRARGAD